MFNQFTLFLDCSSQIIPSHIKQITPFIRKVFQLVLHQFPLSQSGLAIINDERAYLEVNHTESIDSLLVPLVEDQVTPSGTFSLANALKLFNNITSTSYQQKVGFLLCFSPISYDSLNIFTITEELREKNAQFNAISIGTNMQVLRTVTGDLDGFYHVFQSIDQIAGFIPEFKFPEQYAAFPVLVSLSRSLPKTSFCSCCGKLHKTVKICQNCNAALCCSKVCPVCGIYVCDLFEVRRAGIEGEFSPIMGVEGECAFCGESSAFTCSKCGCYYCNGCKELGEKVKMCGNCGL